MIIGLGIDVVELDRIARAMARHDGRFPRKVLTAEEYAAMPAQGPAAVNWVAARFAAKEAASKALGTGFRQGVTLQTVAVAPQPSGKPELVLHGAALDLARELGVTHAFVSLTHGRDVAAAVVVLEG